MNELTTDHYRALLGLDADWRAINVEFLPKAKLVDIRIEYCGSKLFCVTGLVGVNRVSGGLNRQG